jgi:hypothetical protein
MPTPKAILQRIIHIETTRDDHTPETKRLAEALERTPLESVSGFLLAAITRETEILETVWAKTPEWENALMAMPQIKSTRIAKNHAQLIALTFALEQVVRLPEGARQAAEDCLVDLAIERQQAINADHPLVQQFWELFDYLNDDTGLNHSKNGDLAINLNHFVAEAERARQQVPVMADLKALLKTSKARKYVSQKPVSSALWSTRAEDGRTVSKTVKCWVFQREQ